MSGHIIFWCSYIFTVKRVCTVLIWPAVMGHNDGGPKTCSLHNHPIFCLEILNQSNPNKVLSSLSLSGSTSLTNWQVDAPTLLRIEGNLDVKYWIVIQHDLVDLRSTTTQRNPSKSEHVCSSFMTFWHSEGVALLNYYCQYYHNKPKGGVQKN